MQQSTPYLSFRGIGKTFPGVKALTDISFDCYAGQVHALMGENGAGKSTLLKILSGNYAPTTGSVVINGQEMSFSDTTAALNAGVAIIYQELHLVPEMTVAENIYLGQLPHKGGIVNRSLLNYEAGLQLKHLGMDIDPDTPLNISPLVSGRWLKSPKRWRVTPKLSPLMSQPAPSLPAKSTIFSALFVNCEKRGG